MKSTRNTSAPLSITRREGLLLTLLSSAMVLAGCGGGSDSASSSTGVGSVSGGGTGSLSVGPISGIGSIILNGVRYDDSLARVLNDDGELRNRNELKLGMIVRVKGKKDARKSDKTDQAEEISFGSELQGPIDSASINATAQTFKVLGQNVQITATTIFEEGLTFAALADNNVVEVYGFVDPVQNLMTATRIERKVLANVKVFKVQGRVSNLSDTTFQIGTLVISFTSSVLPPRLSLSNGLLVRVRLATTPTTGTRTALRIRQVEFEIEDYNEAEVKGTITAFTSPASFSVNGLQIDASNISPTVGLRLGVRVEVEGRLVKGVLVAKKVELEDEQDRLKFELQGIVSNLTTVPAGVTFTLTSSGGISAKVTVIFTDVFFENRLTAADLRNGIRLEIKGVALSDGTIKATVIKPQ